MGSQECSSTVQAWTGRRWKRPAASCRTTTARPVGDRFFELAPGPLTLELDPLQTGSIHTTTSCGSSTRTALCAVVTPP